MSELMMSVDELFQGHDEQVEISLFDDDRIESLHDDEQDAFSAMMADYADEHSDNLYNGCLT